MSEKRAKNNKTQTAVMIAVVVVGLSMMGVKFFELNQVTTEFLSESAKIREVQKISPSHKKYLGEFLACWERPFGDANNCVGGLTAKYENTSEVEELKIALKNAELIN